MSALNARPVLAEVFGPRDGTSTLAKQVLLVLAGIVVLAIAAKIRIPMWPVPLTMGTFAVLTIGAAYGPRLGLTTVLGYLAIGALGFDVFAGSSATENGLAYMVGGTGGYLVGYGFAALVLGLFARAGWDRSMPKMAAALLVGNAVIYIPGLLWLGVVFGWDEPILAWGLTPFLFGDAVKLVLAAMLVPAVWNLVGDARK